MAKKKFIKHKSFHFSPLALFVIAGLLLAGLAFAYNSLSTTPPIAAISQPCSRTNKTGSDGAFCGDCINSCVSWKDLSVAGGGCQAYINKNCKASPVIYGSSCTTNGNIASSRSWTYSCSCSKYIEDSSGAGKILTEKVWFDKTGSCEGTTGLCAVYQKGACEGSTTPGVTPPQKDTWICDSPGCRITNDVTPIDCFVMKYRCPGTKTGQSCLDTIADKDEATPSQSKTFSTGSEYCGMVEQIDVSCGGSYKESRTKIFPPCSPSPTPIPSPSATPFVKPSPSNNPRPSPKPSPSPIVGMCSSVQIYDTSWKLMSSTSDYATYQSGKQLYLCATGTGSATFTKARFTVNGTLRPEVTFVKPGTSYFCDLYTIPAGTYSFQVTAEVYSPQLGWK